MRPTNWSTRPGLNINATWDDVISVASRNRWTTEVFYGSWTTTNVARANRKINNAMTQTRPSTVRTTTLTTFSNGLSKLVWSAPFKNRNDTYGDFEFSEIWSRHHSGRDGDVVKGPLQHIRIHHVRAFEGGWEPRAAVCPKRERLRISRTQSSPGKHVRRWHSNKLSRFHKSSPSQCSARGKKTRTLRIRAGNLRKKGDNDTTSNNW